MLLPNELFAQLAFYAPQLRPHPHSRRIGNRLFPVPTIPAMPSLLVRYTHGSYVGEFLSNGSLSDLKQRITHSCGTKLADALIGTMWLLRRHCTVHATVVYVQSNYGSDNGQHYYCKSRDGEEQHDWTTAITCNGLYG